MKRVTAKVEIYHKKVLKRCRKKRKTILFKQGAYLRKTMQRSMRYSKKPSQPGQPPHARKNNPLLRKLIKFVVDLVTGTVVCGPEKFKGGSGGKSSKPVPQLLDQGGQVTFSTRFMDPKKIAPEDVHKSKITVEIAPRPFTAPVFTDGGENFRKLLKEVPL